MIIKAIKRIYITFRCDRQYYGSQNERWMQYYFFNLFLDKWFKLLVHVCVFAM